MPERLTFEEIEERFPGEWVVVRDFVPDAEEMIREGVVIAHAGSRAEAHRALAEVRGDYAMWLVGPPSGEIVGYLGILK